MALASSLVTSSPSPRSTPSERSTPRSAHGLAPFDVAVTLGAAHAATCVTSLTSVTMDVCLAKHKFPFANPDLLALTAHLGGGSSILRIGGSDQNDFYYAMNSTRAEPFSAATGGPCCPHVGSCAGCAHDCTMPAPYWKGVVDFAKASKNRLVFGLVPDLDQAKALVAHSAREALPVFGYTFGNEQASKTIADGYPVLRKAIVAAYSGRLGERPKLAGPDLYAQMNYKYSLDEALAGKDPTVVAHLASMETFGAAAGSSLDVFSWHTYDFETPMLGMVDHQDLVVNPLVARLWSTRHLDFALRLQGNVSEIARRTAPGAEVWISESNSICHQGVNGVTNAYLNSLWLVNRLGNMAGANVTVMARQSLVGYNYSLLGNWPLEPIRPNPVRTMVLLLLLLFALLVLTSLHRTTSPPSCSSACSATRCWRPPPCRARRGRPQPTSRRAATARGRLRSARAARVRFRRAEEQRGAGQ